MNRDSRQSAVAHALREHPKEACGLFVRVDGITIYHPCTNLATEADEHFILDPHDYANADELGEIIGVFHSHPNASPEPSQTDIDNAEISGLPWYIVSTPNLQWAYTEPKGLTTDLVGRPFVYGKTDCYTLIRDYFRIEHKLVMNNYDSNDDWWQKGENYYAENFEFEGFKEIPLADLREGDVLLMKVMSPVSNHAALYLGYNTILHHLYGRLSCREAYGSFWRKVTTHALRYNP